MMGDLTLQEEQAAFDQQLDELLRTHEDKYVLFKHGRPVEFFEDHTVAYEVGLDKFGLDATFLIAQVVKPTLQPVSISWETGVMFGQS